MWPFTRRTPLSAKDRTLRVAAKRRITVVEHPDFIELRPPAGHMFGNGQAPDTIKTHSWEMAAIWAETDRLTKVHG